MVFSTLCRCASLCFLLCSAASAKTSGRGKSLFSPFFSTTQFNKTIAIIATRGGASEQPPLASQNETGEKPPFASQNETGETGEGASSEMCAKIEVEVIKKKTMIPMKWAVASGVLLAFNSGFINGACLSGAVAPPKQAVAAVTGAWTNSAVGFASGNIEQFKTQMSMILSYLSGSVIAGALNPHPVAFELSSSTGPLFLIGSVLLYLSSSWATSGKNGMGLFFLAAVANGMQNSITSAHTGNLVRSTHYSGMTSDMGTFLGQILRGNKTNLFRLKVCASLAAAFWLGGYLSFFATRGYAGTSLMFSAVLYAALGLGLLSMGL